MNIWDILILVLITAAVVSAVRKMIKNRHSGGCGCGCSGCSQECANKNRS